MVTKIRSTEADTAVLYEDYPTQTLDSDYLFDCAKALITHKPSLTYVRYRAECCRYGWALNLRLGESIYSQLRSRSLVDKEGIPWYMDYFDLSAPRSKHTSGRIPAYVSFSCRPISIAALALGVVRL